MCYKVLLTLRYRYAVCPSSKLDVLTHAGLNSVLSLKKEFYDKACFFLFRIRIYTAKDMRENRSQSSLQICLCSNHIVAPPHKFVEHGRQERTEVLQSLFEAHKNERVTKHYQ